MHWGIRTRGVAGRGAIAIVVAALVLGLSACADVSAAPSTLSHAVSPSASAAPITLAEVRAAYAAYSRASQKISAEGGVHPERLREFVTDSFYKYSASSFRSYVQHRIHIEGVVHSTVKVLQTSDPRTATAYVCIDGRGTRVVNDKGKDVTPAKRTPYATLVVGFERVHSSVLVSESKSWYGTSVC